MRVLIVSDIHGELKTFQQILKAESYDYLISLGDSELSASDLKPVDELVHGNVFMDLGQPYIIKELSGLKVVMTHGHLCHVQRGDEGLIEKGKDFQATLIMHGHTHIARFEKSGPYYLLNPGALYGPRGSWPATYVILKIEENQFTVDFKTLNQTILRSEKGAF